MHAWEDGSRDITREANNDAADAERAWANTDPADLDGVPVATRDWWHVGWRDAWDGRPQTPPADPDAAREYQAGYRECETWVRPRPDDCDTPAVVVTPADPDEIPY